MGTAGTPTSGGHNLANSNPALADECFHMKFVVLPLQTESLEGEKVFCRYIAQSEVAMANLTRASGLRLWTKQSNSAEEGK